MPDAEEWERELAEVTALALAAEQPPVAVPPLVSNTLAAVSAYAEAVTDGVEHELRRALFEAVWVDRRHLSSAYDVRSVITSVTYPPFPILPYLASELPPPGLGDPDPLHMTRLLGGTVAPNGIPLTTTGWRRALQWRRGWLALPAHVVPTVIDDAGTARPGVQALAHLGALLTEASTRRTPVVIAPRRVLAEGDARFRAQVQTR